MDSPAISRPAMLQGLPAVKRDGLQAARASNHRFFQRSNLTFDHSADPHFGHIDLRGAHTERFLYLVHWPLHHDVQVEHLVLLRVDALLDANDCGFQQISLPFLVPKFFHLIAVWVWHPLDRRRSPLIRLTPFPGGLLGSLARQRSCGGMAMLRSPSHLVGNPPPRNLK